MNLDTGPGPEPLLSIPGAAADHLYREGSAKASFWEAVFGSSLRAKNRTRVSALSDGTRVFDVPLLAVEAQILALVQSWAATHGSGSAEKDATRPGGLNLRIRLIGFQGRGESVATFSLRFEAADPDLSAEPSVAQTLRSWFHSEGPRVARDLLIPFGFTPHLS